MSVATTYAEALFEASVEAGVLGPVAAGMGEFAAAYSGSDDLRLALESPDLDPDAKRRVVRALAEDAHPFVANTLQMLIDRGRIADLPEIAAAFDRRVTVAEGRLEVEAVTAIPLPDDLRGSIVSSIQEQTGRSVDLSESVDPDIVGGLVLRVGETVVDGSVRSRLDQLRREMTTASVDSAAVAD
ncbi:MAG: ATP synthase F1 subunit delta [Miltoncostaeaceae bacterium]